MIRSCKILSLNKLKPLNILNRFEFIHENCLQKEDVCDNKVLQQNRLFSLSSALHLPDAQHVTSKTTRTIVVPVETSIKYMQSAAFKEAYGDETVWTYYRRNHKGQRPPSKTRKMCIRNNVVLSSACPICRDEYLVVDYRNVELLKHFISPITGELLSYNITSVCQQQYQNLVVALMQAKDYGYYVFDQPFRSYNYRDYYKSEN